MVVRRRVAYLYKLHHRWISNISTRCDPRRRECIWQDLEDNVASRIGDGQGGDSDCAAHVSRAHFKKGVIIEFTYASSGPSI